MNMAQNMHKYEPSDYITAQYIQQLEYNEQVVKTAVRRDICMTGICVMRI